jgi:hypothetical protein
MEKTTESLLHFGIQGMGLNFGPDVTSGSVVSKEGNEFEY